MNPVTKVYLEAISVNAPEIAATLLEKYGDQIDVANHGGECLVNACKTTNIGLIKLLLKQGADPSYNSNYVIRVLPDKGDFPEVIAMLLANPKCDPIASTNISIRNACTKGRIETVKLLLADTRVDPSASNNECINYAAQEGHTEIVKCLLAHPKVDPTNVDCRPIRYAGNKGHKEVVKILLQDARMKMDQIKKGCEENNAMNSYFFIESVKKEMDASVPQKSKPDITGDLKDMMNILSKILTKLE